MWIGVMSMLMVRAEEMVNAFFSFSSDKSSLSSKVDVA